MNVALYAEQSAVTDPGRMAGWLADLPDDVPALRRIACGLVVHYRAADLAALGIPAERVAEVDTRYAEQMLERLFALDERPLTVERPPQHRLVGCCRDFTVLYLTMLRHRGIPARARVGFANYFIPGWSIDHEVAEVWDAADQRWRLIDAELADTHVDTSDDTAFDALDVPRDRFLVAGEAWVACRTGQADPARFVVDPGLTVEETRGWPQLRCDLMHDLATLNKREMLLWDNWGLIDAGQLSDKELMLLDGVAEVTRAVCPELSVVERLYAGEPGLHVPATVTSHSPATAVPREVIVAS